jgi:hypothetical protein
MMMTTPPHSEHSLMRMVVTIQHRKMENEMKLEKILHTFGGFILLFMASVLLEAYKLPPWQSLLGMLLIGCAFGMWSSPRTVYVVVHYHNDAAQRDFAGADGCRESSV